VGWGGLAKYMYGPTSRYAWVAWGLLLGLFAPAPFWIIHKLAPNFEWITGTRRLLRHPWPCWTMERIQL